jgi:hypothetical protein
LHAVNHIEDYFTFVDIDYNIFEATICCVTAPDTEIEFARH